MKIVFNTDQIYLHGGVEKVMATKANYWAQDGTKEVLVITVEQRGHKPCYDLDDRIGLMDLGVDYNRSKSFLSLENIRKAFIHLHRQWKLYKDLQPDVVISPNYNFDHYWLPFILPRHTKLVKEIHGSRYQEYADRQQGGIRSKLKFWFQDCLDSRYDRIVVLNPDEAQYRKTDNVDVIANPIQPSGLTAGLSSKKVIAAGRIAPVKGFDELIAAWAMVNKEYPDWRLHIYGEDYLGTTADLRGLIDKLGLQGKVIFKGSVSDMTAVMQDYSIYAMTSVTECLPMVLLEALSIGLPIVSYDCPNGPRHIIRDGQDGLLVRARNVASFANGLQQLMGQDELRISFGKEAKKGAIRFSLQETMPQWERMFADLRRK